MNQEMIISIINQVGGTASQLVTQIAFFFAIKAAASWFSFTLPCLLLFGVLLKIAKTQKTLDGNDSKVGGTILAAWIVFSLSLFTGTRGVAHILQAALSPVVYTATEVGDITQVLKREQK
jgi:hypothetical protein